MANPRQRRKVRSGNHKPVQHSRRAKTLLKKQPPIRGPKVLQDAWDPRKTVRQNYDALGLVASLNPIASGGSERPLGARVESEEPEEGAEASTSSQPAAPASAARAVPKGYGKIIRDAAGNVVDVVIADEEEEEEDAAVAAGEGGLEEVADPGGDAQLASWVGLGAGHTRRGEGAGGSEGVVEALEQLSATRGGPVRRHTSKGERGVLRALVSKHGEDLEAMARDRRLNVDQRTAGELGRAIRKAGGFGAVVGTAG